MIRRVIGVILVLWGGSVLAGFAADGFKVTIPAGRPAYGHRDAYVSGARAAMVTAGFMFIGGLFLLFSRRDYRAPEPGTKKKKRYKIVVPKPPDDL